jgi:zinc finger protein 830
LTKQHRASVTREKTQSQGSSKTKRPAEEAGSNSKRARTEEVVKSSILPAGFFSGGSGPTIVADEDEEEEEETPKQAPVKAQVEAGPSTVKAPAPTIPSTTPANGQTGDQELDSFLASLAEPDPENETNETEPAPTAATQKASTSKKSTYRDIIPGQASYEAAPIRNIPKDQDPEPEPEVQETEAEKRARLAREEREEIMDRLEEEERAQ